MGLINLHRGVDTGTHKMKIVSVDEKYGPSGYPYLILQLEIVRGDSKGQQFSDMLSESPQSRFRMEPFLDAIGAPAKGQMDSSELVGKYAWGEVEPDTSRDPVRPRVSKWLVAPADDVEEEEEEEEDNGSSQMSIPELAEEEDESPFGFAEETMVPSGAKKKSKKEELTLPPF